MSIGWILLAAIAALLGGYFLVGCFLEKKWGIDPTRETPSQDCFDGKDYVPTPPALVFGHHFASIASGLGMIGGAFCAFTFGWLPALLVLVLGGIFFGATQDFGALFVSLRTKGRSIGHMLRDAVGVRAQRAFTVLALLVLVQLIAVLVRLLADAFGAQSGLPLVSLGAAQVSEAAAAGTAAILSVLVALLFGLLAFRKNLPMVPVAIFSLLLLAGSVWASFYLGLNLPPFVWVGVIALSLILAALAPVWAVLQPRDFLCACLVAALTLLGVVALAGAALGGKVEMTLPAVSSLGSLDGFFLLCAGAASGYHALVAAGTTPKQLANEKNARGVAVGATLLKTLLAVIAVLAVALAAEKDGTAFETNAVPALLAAGLATAWNALFGGSGEIVANGLVYRLVLLTLTVFALTTLDTAARLARYLFSELFNPEGRRLAKLEGAQKFFARPLVGTLLVLIPGCALALMKPGDSSVMDMLMIGFWIDNLLLAAMALWSLAVWMKRNGKASWLLRVPAAICMLSALFAQGIVWILVGLGTGSHVFDWCEYLLMAFPFLALVLTAILLVQLLTKLWKKEKTQEAADDAD